MTSGFFETGTNTPTGKRRRIAVDNPYLTKDELLLTPEIKGFTTDNLQYLITNGYLDKIILQASSLINRFCQRYFDTQTIDEIKTRVQIRPYNPSLVTIYLANAPLQKIEKVWLQVLKWFIELNTSESGYIQEFYEEGYYKIVPLLFSGGGGIPIPSQIAEKTNLGIIWTRYTFGYGEKVSGYELKKDSVDNKKYYVEDYNYKLWAPSQGVKVYLDNVLIGSSFYNEDTGKIDYNGDIDKIDFPNGIVYFKTGYSSGKITADFITNSTIPEDIKYATRMLVMDILVRGEEALGGVIKGANSPNYSIEFSDEVKERVKGILLPYVRNFFKIL